MLSYTLYCTSIKFSKILFKPKVNSEHTQRTTWVWLLLTYNTEQYLHYTAQHSKSTTTPTDLPLTKLNLEIANKVENDALLM